MDPRDKSQQQKNQPNPTNKDTKITNSEDQNKIDEDVEEKSVPRGRKDENNPEINTPVYDPNKTEKKIPDMGDKK